jgi:Fe-S oxidoreductase
MKTEFSLAQLADPDIQEADKILRACVHCGFCTATCPTYVLLGDELDSPRGRIYLIKQMLEKDEKPTADVVKHIDRCLSCLACMTTCPSGVNYMHLVDQARVRIERDYSRPLIERAKTLVKIDPALGASLADWAWLAAPDDAEVLRGVLEVYGRRSATSITTQEALAYLEHMTHLRLRLDDLTGK